MSPADVGPALLISWQDAAGASLHGLTRRLLRGARAARYGPAVPYASADGLWWVRVYVEDGALWLDEAPARTLVLAGERVTDAWRVIPGWPLAAERAMWAAWYAPTPPDPRAA